VTFSDASSAPLAVGAPGSVGSSDMASIGASKDIRSQARVQECQVSTDTEG
jgi:hypothetical protein